MENQIKGVVDENREKTANLTLHQAKKIANSYMEEIKVSDAADLYSYNKLNQFVEELVAQDELCGNANDYHNFAVELSREKQEHLACLIIERGLKQFPSNVDLLSDYLQYGISIGKEKECKEVYEKLMKIPNNRWSWRGFSFSINYLQHILDDISESSQQMEELKEKIIQIADDYVKYLPYSEEGYRAKARVYSSIKDNPNAEIEILKECLSIVKVCPKSALRSADIYFERGEYEKALECVDRAIKDANQTQGSINEGYVYYLSGLCKMSMLGAEAGREIDETVREKVVDIFVDFDSAFLEFGLEIDGTYKRVMIKKAKLLKSRYEVDIPFKCKKLLENMDE